MNFNHKVIHMCWSQDLNEIEEVLAFAFQKHTITAKYAGLALIRDGFKAMILDIKKASQVLSSAHYRISSG